MKLNKTKIAIGLLSLGFFVIVRYAMRDLELDLDILREGLINMPGMVMENMRLSREIEGDVWSLTIPRIERRDSLITVQSLDVRREIKNGGEWYFMVREGVYMEDKKAAVLDHVLGTLNFGSASKDSINDLNNAENSRIMNLESPRVTWHAPDLVSSAIHEIVFPEGLSLYDQEFLITAQTASMDSEGVILFEDGGLIQWIKPIDWDSSLYPPDLDLDLDLEDIKY